MFGLISKIRAAPGRGADLIAAMRAEGTLPGCLSYVIAIDADDADLLWVTEVWSDAQSHAASLDLAEVKAAIGRARPLIAGFERVATTKPV